MFRVFFTVVLLKRIDGSDWLWIMDYGCW